MNVFTEDDFDAPTFPSDSQVQGAAPLTSAIPARPLIATIAKFQVRTDNLEDARRLQNPASDRLTHIGFATAGARELLDYLALSATTPRGVNT